jgi:glutathione S-transferase
VAEIQYELYYWPTIQGRGEFVRLALEEAGAPYIDVARLPESQGGGVAALMKFLRGEADGLLPFAPPFLKCGELVIAQTSNILGFLGPRLGLVAPDEPSRLCAMQLSLTIADFVAETHDVHHPIAVSLYYEDQKPEAQRCAGRFVAERIPKFLGYFERVLSANGGEHFVGRGISYVDLSVFQVISGLEYAFPRAMAQIASRFGPLWRLRDRVKARPRIAAYLSSSRRVPFNQHGIFRHYPELDVPPAV